MKSRFRHFLPVLTLALSSPAALGQGQGRAAAHPEAAQADALHAQGAAAMEAEHWEDALKLFDRCIELYGKDAIKKFGPSFGANWYRKGVCEAALGRLDAAIKSFETCYRDFPNKGKTRDNIFHKRALLRWAETANKAGQPAEALRLFQKFMAERDRQNDTFDPASYYLSVAVCHLRLGNLAMGAENLETAVRNKNGFGSPESGIVGALQELTAAAITKKDERILLSFFEGVRGSLAMEPFEMAAYPGEFIKLANDALAAGMDSAALAIFRLLPASEAMEEDLRVKLDLLGEAPQMVRPGTRPLPKLVLEERLAALEKARREGNSHEILLLEASAGFHEKRGNLRGARAAFAELEARFPKATRRADHLFHLVRLDSAIGDAEDSSKHAAKLMAEFPDSPRTTAVRRMVLVALFEAGQHEACIKAASELLPKLAEGSQDHDACLRVLANSFEQTGRFEEARPLLERYLALYPSSPHAQAALYLQAANRVETQQWEEAAKLLDAFIAKYPDAATNPYLASALLDRAECCASTGDNDAALAHLKRLENDFPDSEVLANAQGLKGDLLLRQNRGAEAEESLKKALQQAEKLGQREAAAEILLRMVDLLDNDPKRLKEAVPWCERFWKNYSDLAPLCCRMAIAQAEPMAAAGKSEQALERLSKELSARIANPAAGSPDELARPYAKLYAKSNGLDELKRHFAEFPGVKPEDKQARAALRILVIETVEDDLDASDHAAKAKADALMRTLFQELKADFEAKDLPPGILVRTGDFLRTRTSAPRQALPYYEEALARKDEATRFPALLGRAAVLAEGSKEERAAAIKDLEEVFAGSKEPREREDALFWLVMTRMKAADFAAAGESATRYLAADSGFQRLVPEVRLALARSYQERGMANEAIAAHAKVWADFGELPRVAVPAMRAWMQLSWTRQAPANGAGNSRSDRQAAYEEGMAFLERTRSLFGKMAPVDQETWLEIEKLTKDFAATTDVKPLPKPAPSPTPAPSTEGR